MRRMLLRAALPAVLACAVVASPALAKSKHGSSHEEVCKPAVTAVGEGVTSGRARKHAIEAWKTKVKSDLGADYADAQLRQEHVDALPQGVRGQAGVHSEGSPVQGREARQALALTRILGDSQFDGGPALASGSAVAI